MLLPHDLFCVLYNEHPDQFSEKLDGTGGVAERFWKKQRGNPLLVDRPLTHEPEWSTKTIPVILHGDATPVAGICKAWGKMPDVYTFSSLLTQGTSRKLMFYMYAGFVRLMTGASMRDVWAVLVWSLRALATSRWPERDHFGPTWKSGAAKGQHLVRGRLSRCRLGYSWRPRLLREGCVA